MKTNYIAIILSLAVALSTAKATGSETAELISNGSFADGSDGSVPDYWTTERGDSVARIPLDDQTGFGVKIESQAKFEDDARYFIRQDNIAFESGKTYTLSYRAKADPGVSYRIYCEVTTGEYQGSSLTFFSGNGEWQEHTLDVRFEDLKAAPYIIAQVTGLGSGVFADISLRPADAQ